MQSRFDIFYERTVVRYRTSNTNFVFFNNFTLLLEHNIDMTVGDDEQTNGDTRWLDTEVASYVTDFNQQYLSVFVLLPDDS